MPLIKGPIPFGPKANRIEEDRDSEEAVNSYENIEIKTHSTASPDSRRGVTALFSVQPTVFS